MKQADYLNGKVNFDIRKRPINGKLFQNQKMTKEEFILNPKKAMGKKYMQQPNIFKQRCDQPKKQHREIVMSQEFIKSSKLYRLLKQKMDRSDSIFIKQVNATNEQKLKLKGQIMQIKTENYQEKVSLWELKNKLMELKIMYHEEEEESRRLAEQNYGEYGEEEQYEGENEEGNNQNEQEEENNLNQQEEGQQEMERLGHKTDQNQGQDMINDRKTQYQQRQQEQTKHNKKYEQIQTQQDKQRFSQILCQLMNSKSQRDNLSHALQQSHASSLTQQLPVPKTFSPSPKYFNQHE